MNTILEPQVKIELRHACSECGISFSRPYRLKQHHNIVHKKIKQYVCGEPNCSKTYTTKSHLDRHIQTVHMEKEINVIYSCPKCMKVYANRQNLKRHIKIHHGKPALTCDVCKKIFKKKHQLSAHMYEHTLVKSFSCDLCNFEFITLLDKKKHQKRHKTYSCDQCDMAFLQWSKYLKHKRMIHNVKEYICHDCGRRFKKRGHMVHHSKTHILRHTPKFYSCTFDKCDRVYARNSSLKQHIKIKHLLMKQECEICSAKLSRKVSLRKHIETHCKQKANIHQPTKEMGRKERSDIGELKTSTALKISGLLVDPENGHIKRTIKIANSNPEMQNEDEILESKDILL